MTTQEKYMKRCLDLAKNGLGLVYPNPMVGSVLVRNDLIIGEGWHQKAGGPHAEVNAINSVSNKKMISEATLYVNLEPCSHHGKTPPCADYILSNGIKKVVIGAIDSNDEVGGKGVKRLRDNGVEVVVSVLENECRDLNKRFYTYHEKNRPFVILKWAQSKDGFIFPDPNKVQKGSPFWISNKYALQRVHQYRAEEAAILVGKNTVLQDDPQLNVRDFVGNQILRLVIDKKLEISKAMRVFDDSSKTIVYNEAKDSEDGHVVYVKLDFDQEVVPQIMSHLHDRGVHSLIVEGGSITLNSFIGSGYWDEARVFIGGETFENGIKAPVLNGILESKEVIDDNLLNIYKPA